MWVAKDRHVPPVSTIVRISADQSPSIAFTMHVNILFGHFFELKTKTFLVIESSWIRTLGVIQRPLCTVC